ncbi:MAG: Flagellar basal body L-ring protein-like protein [Petrotoga mobilis]|nr:MAG: Flagellar basal body L-ring protein-like protein [Petrotoga mobilis]
MNTKKFSKVLIFFLTFLVSTSLGFSESLWNKSDEQGNSIFNYNQDFGVGDVVTIIVSENPSLSLSENMPDYKKASVDTVNSVVNKMGGVDLSNFLPIGAGDPTQVSVQNNQKSSSSSAEVQLFISSIIQEKDQNGLLKIRGEKEIKVGNNKNTIIVEGYVSPKNIAKDGTIFSSSLANAKIWYDGDIIFQQDPNEPSWLTSILSGIANIFF